MSDYDLTKDELAALMTGEVPQTLNCDGRLQSDGTADMPRAVSPNSHSDETASDIAIWSSDLQVRYRHIMASFANGFASQLQTPLRTEVTIDIQSIREAIYGELIIRMDNPTCVQLLSAVPLTADYVFELHPTVLFPVFDRLLGGGALPTPVVRRPLTEIETRLAGRVTRPAATELTNAWSSIVELHVAATRLVGNPRMMRSENPNEPMIVTQFHFAMAGSEGPIQLAIRKSALLEIADELHGSAPTAHR